ASEPGTSPLRGPRRRPTRGRAGTSFSRQVRLGQIRSGPAQHLVLLLEQPQPLLHLPELGQLGARPARLQPVVTVGPGEPVRQTGLGDPEVRGDVFDPDPRLAAPGNPDHLIAELLRIRLRHGRHPFSGASRHHTSDVTSPRGSPCARSSLNPTPRRCGPSTPASSNSSTTSSPTPPPTSPTPHPMSSRSPGSPRSTGARSGRTTPRSGSTRNSAGGPTSSGSSRTATPWSASSAPCSPNSTTSGPSPGATWPPKASPEPASASSTATSRR